MKVTVTNLTLNQLSTDVGLLQPSQTLVMPGVSPERCHKMATVMKTLVDAGRITLAVTNDDAAANELEMYTSAEGIVLEGGGDLTLRTDLASTANAKGASLVAIEDAGTLYTAADVEAALAEVRTLANGTVTDLASTANAKGASLVGIEDAAANFTAATVEAALAEAMKYVPLTLADPGTGVAIPVTRSASIAITTAAAETNTLAIPTFVGQKLLLHMNVRVGGDRVVTAAAAINQAGNTIMTFGAAGDAITLEAIRVAGTLRWQVTSNDGVALS